MASRFMSILRIVLPMLTLIILCSQVTGCAILNSKDMVKMINAGQSITLELAKPTYQIVVKGTQQDIDWVQLDQLKSNKVLRVGFDEAFNINTVTESGVNGKSGCLYVDQAEDRNGNTTLADGFRNKVFIKYWNDPKVKSSLTKLADEEYTDIDGKYAIEGALNSYYNLLPDALNPSSFNPTQSLSREQFYSLVYKASQGVKNITPDKSFEDAIGGATKLSKYAQEIANKGFLSVEDKSLDFNSYTGSISRAEAIYLVVNTNFADKLGAVTGKEKSYSDCKNAGDLANDAGFKAKNKDTKEIMGKDRWQLYTLAYMLQHPDKGMEQELYKSMVVAKQLGLIDGDTSRWDEPISKSEAIDLVVYVQLAKNKVYGYLSTVEYGKINKAKFNVSTEERVVTGVDANGMKYGSDWTEVPLAMIPVDPNKKLSSGMSLQDAKRMIDGEKKRAVDRGSSEADTTALLTQLVKDLGTTLEEVSRVQAEPVPVIKKTEPVKTETAKIEPAKPAPTTAPVPVVNGGKWEDMPEWQKAETVSPDDIAKNNASGHHPDYSHTPNPFK